MGEFFFANSHDEFINNFHGSYGTERLLKKNLWSSNFMDLFVWRSLMTCVAQPCAIILSLGASTREAKKAHITDTMADVHIHVLKTKDKSCFLPQQEYMLLGFSLCCRSSL